MIVTTDDLGAYRQADFGPNGDRVAVWDRTRLIEAQEVLAAVDGVTVLVHDQACAAEKRRARSRGTLAKPAFRIVINERVCEGCGDCGDKSNCLSVQPVMTDYGRKTRIHQTSCNFDMTCLEGDCPSFALVSVDTDAARPAAVSTAPGLATARCADGVPDPVPIVPTDEFVVRLSGIGGTGVITVSQILGTAAMLGGRTVRGLDQTGLSQKAGPVVSDLRISANGTPLTNRANSAGVDCFLAFDLLVAASDAHRTGARAGRTVVIGSAAPTPTGAMVAHPTTPYPELDVLTGRLGEASRTDDNRYPNAAAITTGLFGDAATANIFLLGVAVQSGAVPVEASWIERAIELNGVAVQRNVTAFRWGRRWYALPDEVEQAAGFVSHPRRRRSTSSSSVSPTTSLTTSRRATPPASAESSTRPAEPSRRRSRLTRVHRRRRPQPAQADGLQGRVRSRPAPAAAGVTRRLRDGRRTEHEGDVAPAPAGAAGDGTHVEVGVRATHHADVQGAACGQATAWHGARPVPLAGGAPRRKGDDPRVHRRRGIAVRRADHREPRRGDGHRRAARPGPRLRGHQAAPRRALPRRSSPTELPRSTDPRSRASSVPGPRVSQMWLTRGPRTPRRPIRRGG